MTAALRALRRVCVALGTSSIAFGCGSSGSDESSGASGGFAGDYCKLISQCCSAKFGVSFDASKCATSIASIGAVDATAGALCLDQLKKNGEYCVPRTGGADLFFGCDTAFRRASGQDGKAQPGEPCAKRDDCASSLEGDIDCASYVSGGISTSKCQVNVHGKVGDGPCIGTANEHYKASATTDPGPKPISCYTFDGVYCESASKTCKPIPNIGDACVSDTNWCGGGGFCDTTTNKCVAPVSAGSSCAGDQICADDTYCDSGTKTCTPLLAGGKTCTSSEQCQSKHCDSGACHSGNLCTEL